MIAYPWSLDGKPPPTHAEHKRWRFFEQHLPGIALGLMVVLLLAVVLFPHMVKTVPSGQVGVLWKRFNGPGIYCWCILRRGTVLNPEEIRGEGLHIIWPWDELFMYDLRLQSTTETYNAISRDGVSLSATINVRTQLNYGSVPVLHKFIGPSYIQRIVTPEIGSRTREVISQYDAEQVYSTKRLEIEQQIRNGARANLNRELTTLMQPEASEQSDAADAEYKRRLQGAVLIVDTLVLSIELPPTVVGAINRKAEQYYLVQEYRYRVERETLESDRKRIEAEGIRDFQKTVSQGISNSYLRWRGIEATVQLSQSSNSKVVVIGSGKDGLPIILGNVDAAPANAAAPKPDGTETDKRPASEAAKPAEKTPPADETKPADKTPTAEKAKPAEKTAEQAKAAEKTAADGSAKPAAASSDGSRSAWPVNFSDLEALLTKLLRSKDAEPTAKSTEKSATEKAPEAKTK